MVINLTLSAVESRLARAGLELGVRELAELAQVSPGTIARLERGERLQTRTLAAIRAALEADGVEFIPIDKGGPGVRLRRVKVMYDPDGRVDGADPTTSFEVTALQMPTGDDRIEELEQRRFANEDECTAAVKAALDDQDIRVVFDPPWRTKPVILT